MSKLIYKKINNIMEKVEFIHKDGNLGFGNNTFKVVTFDNVVSKIRKHFIDEGVLIIPNQIEKGISIEGTTKSGTKKIRFEAMFEIEFVAVEDGSSIKVKTEAHAEDNSDKATGKAITYATKNAILKVLLLQTGDDKAQEDNSNKVSKKEIDKLRLQLSNCGLKDDDFLSIFNIKIEECASSYFTWYMEEIAKNRKESNSLSTDPMQFKQQEEEITPQTIREFYKNLDAQKKGLALKEITTYGDLKEQPKDALKMLLVTLKEL